MPTPGDVVGEAFLRLNRFNHSGTVCENDEMQIRLERRAADRIATPDLYSAFSFDSATAQL